MATNLDTGWDLSVTDRNGQLALVAEVKRKINAFPEWAVRLRRNILAHGTFPEAPYFLMVFPDRFYLWTNIEAHLDQSEPAYIIDARPILQPYFQQAGVTANQISGQRLELIVASWLGEVMHSEQTPENQSQRWLVDLGIYAALADGRVEREMAA